MQNKYNELQTQYNNTQTQLNDNSLVSVTRTSPNNPYLNKNIHLTENTSSITDRGFSNYGGYVTEQGLYKPYNSPNSYRSTIGKNGCPNNNSKSVGINEFSSSLLPGEPMIAGQSCGNEGKNVYVSKLASNPVSSYVGCYNDKPAATLINAIPIMNSSNSVNGFNSYASSTYQGNNAYGPWSGFDQNPNTFWHAGVASNNLYNAATGLYIGTNSIPINTVYSGILTIKGEFLQINMPGVNTDAVQNIKVTQYSIAPRLDLITQRSPNTWYLIGYKDGQWYEVDHQVGQQFTSSAARSFSVAKSRRLCGIYYYCRKSR